MLNAIALAAICALFVDSAHAQGTRADHERANTLFRRSQNSVFKMTVAPHWDSAGNSFWYRNDLPGGAREFIRVDAERGQRQLAFDHEKLAQALAKVSGKEAVGNHLPIDDLFFEIKEESFRLLAHGQWWRCTASDYALEKASVPETAPMPRTARNRGIGRGSANSPDGKWTAFVKDGNLCVRNLANKEETSLSSDAKPDDRYTGAFFWSPDSRRLVALRQKSFEERKIYLIESSPRDQLQPKLHSLGYRKPGDPIDITKPHLFDIENKKEIAVSDELHPTPWDLEEFRWERDSKRFTFRYNQRGHQVLRVVGVDADTGKATALVDDQSKTFIDYAHKSFSHYLDETGELLWMSERDGWNHLYLYDLKAGSVKNQVTRGNWVVRRVERVDPKKRQIWFEAGGIRPGQDPYYIHHCRVNFDGSGLVILTEGDGTHTVQYSPDRRFVVDTCSRVDLPPVTELRRCEDGKLLCALEQADDQLLQKVRGPRPERFVAKGRDGQTDIYGVIFRPTNFDPTRNYPVIEQIYAGPQGAFVPKGFRPVYGTEALAELGFVVVQIDGMGTNWRSKAFHDVCCKNLGDSGFPDRILWMKAAAAKYPYLDLSRVGVYGGSAGGQSALGALLTHGEFYKVAVADCGCHDNRMDKIWWNELWMGWPLGPHYAEQSNVTNARNLTGKLLLMVGEVDRNVDPASTMQVVNALIKADKDFDLLVVPGGQHGAGSGPYGTRRRNDFFVRHLLGVEPRSTP
jgi:dipeptidyl aminopeptidase/acylaminoacyl peptidase